MNDVDVWNDGCRRLPVNAAQQSTIPPTVHNLPSSVPPDSVVSSNLIIARGYELIAAGVTSTQPGNLSIQRYIDPAGLVPQGAPVSVALTAGSPATLNITDGLPFASFQITISNTTGTTSYLSNLGIMVQAASPDAPWASPATPQFITKTITAQNTFTDPMPVNKGDAVAISIVGDPISAGTTVVLQRQFNPTNDWRDIEYWNTSREVDYVATGAMTIRVGVKTGAYTNSDVITIDMKRN